MLNSHRTRSATACVLSAPLLAGPLLLTLLLLAGGLQAAGCAQTHPIRVDGVASEWRPGVALTGDGEWVYVRFSPEGERYTLQAGSGPTRVLLDTDNSAATGEVFTAGETSLGAEFEIVLSPRRGDGSAGNGTSVRDLRGGEPSEIGHAGAGFHFAPTYASGAYELRLSREKLGLTGAGPVTCAVVHGDWSEAFSGALPEMTGAVRPSPAVPSKALGHLRVQSWNVLWASPVKNPEPFGRIIKGLRPDVLLFQEWSDTDDDAMNEWFATHAEIPNRRWQSVTQPSMGVAVVTTLPIVRRLDEEIGLPGERAVRFVGAVVMTGKGPVLVGSMHLKCCGSYGSDEDLRRQREAQAISAFISGVIDRVGVRTVIIGGDLNLVGSRPPLDTLAAGLDVDGTDLAIADPGVLGDNAVYTWRDDPSSFSPGRLDYVLVGEAQAKIERAFVFDTSLADPGSLGELGMEAGDSGATDHLAVVVDIEVCPDGCD
ncbi:MAG: endonuclease/exonuclease/phosphatase family metal-dependent hydrolase [Phycisphaerales bacterium]|jgi:endonuclease/exonuclease/phosphatase family metal-dependent hydrolase